MQRLQHFMIIYFLFFISGEGNTQVLAPDFQCVKNNTLFWSVPINTCGSFNSYDIFFSADVNGPYTLLTSITSPGTNQYNHVNPGGMTWYYYMESDYNCPGELVLQSDTLNNEAPIATPFESVSVLGNSVELTWAPSPSPEVNAYVIFKETPGGTFPIDTVFNATTYIDNNVFPNNQSELYYVVAIDPCGNTSIFDLPHQTILLQGDFSACEQNISLKWNPYVNWINGVEQQEVWLGINGDLPIAIDTINSVDTAYVYSNANDGDTYCFYLRNIESGTSAFSLSNEICFTLDIVQPMRNLMIKNVSVNENNEVELTWRWDTDAEINAIDILRSTQDNGIGSSAASFPPVFPLDVQNYFTDNTISANNGQLFYQIQTTDDCDTLARSDYASTIFLSGVAQSNRTNSLSWTAFNINGGEAMSYDLYRMVDGNEFFLATLDATVTTYTDPVDATNSDEANVCYYVIANSEVTCFDGDVLPIESRSNTFCVEQLTVFYTPNAFAPSGVNKEFRPRVIFGDAVQYQMTIFNRWGAKVFETTSITEGWNGKKNGSEQPEGAYVYYIKMTQPSGRVVEDKGVLLLMW